MAISDPPIATSNVSPGRGRITKHVTLNAMAMVGLGLIAHNGDEAVLQYSRAMAVQPTDVGCLLLASAFERQGRARPGNSREGGSSLATPEAIKARRFYKESKACREMWVVGQFDFVNR